MKTEEAPSVQLVVDNKDAPPTSAEDSLEYALRLYLDKATAEEKKVLQDEDVRSRVLDEIKPVLPILERVSDVTVAEANRLKLEETRTILDSHIALACKNAILEEEKKTLIHELRTDPQTGVASSYAYKKDIEEAMNRSIEKGEPLWLFAGDLDGLKGINDKYGHEVGNKVLSEVTKRLQEVVRREDLIYRVGGDEFQLLLRPKDEEGAELIKQRLLNSVNLQPVCVKIRFGTVEIPATISIGTSRFIAGDGKEAMEERADVDMYRNKKARKEELIAEKEFEEAEIPTSVRAAILSSLPPTPKSKLSIAGNS